MASIERRVAQDGTVSFRVKIRVKGHAPVSASFRRKTDALKHATRVEADILAGRYKVVAEARRHTFADLCDEYIKQVLPLQPKSEDKKRLHLAYWRAKFGPLWLADITPAAIVQCRNELLAGFTKRKRLRTPATVVRYLATLSHAFSIAMRDWQWVEDNPVRKITKPREPRGRERFLSDVEREKLLVACRQSKSPVLYAVVVLAISTGMRRGEIMNLKWIDVDLQRGTILLRETKNDTSRCVPLIGHAKQLLEDLSKVRRIDTVLIFPNLRGKGPVELKRPWDTAIDAAGLEDFRFHDLRHTAASYLAMNGATTVEIAAVLGHKTLDMVRRYSHLTNGHTAKVVAAMNDKIFGGVVNG